jgi:hypothetical protein
MHCHQIRLECKSVSVIPPHVTRRLSAASWQLNERLRYTCSASANGLTFGLSRCKRTHLSSPSGSSILMRLITHSTLYLPPRQGDADHT